MKLKAKEVKAMSKESLSQTLLELRKEALKNRAQVAVRTPKSTGRIRDTRKAIARVLTELNK